MEKEGIIERSTSRGKITHVRKMTPKEMEKFVLRIQLGKDLSSKKVATKIAAFNSEIMEQALAYRDKYKVKGPPCDGVSVRNRGKALIGNSRRYAALGLIGTIIALVDTKKGLAALSDSAHFKAVYDSAQEGDLHGVERHLLGGPESDYPTGDHLFGDMVRTSEDPKIVYGSLGFYHTFAVRIREYLMKKQEQLNGLPDD